ncbi:amidase family protein [Paenibacillus tundrae]|uniref:Asp-tRNA(Asn)/Glu-tRNA(Gln) amidotransferase A subunit family amidase n=1 Tax=Paenibacillus tundrae TaxID=528187 RepID=A0ABT9WI90_9BACL|nr:amidase family protein [Paenibacillus tundrae]MDQ0172908.1 Asp-tRNA(Asn)/Glu-tRNA(Gln) amidotransferase A subunit family amidase [Paenibacillus tundrae]
MTYHGSVFRKGGALLVATAVVTTTWGGTAVPSAFAATAAPTSKTSTATTSTAKAPATAATFVGAMEEAATLAGVPFTMDKLSGTTIKRKDAAVALQQWLNLDSATISFKDVPEQADYADAVAALNAAGLMKGYTDTLFLPHAILTENDVAVLKDRIYNYIKPFVLEEATIMDLQTAMTQGKLTSKELVQQYLDRIEKYDDQGVSLKAVLTINPDALQIAEQLDEERAAQGARGPLHGIPVLVKDNFDTKDMPTTAGCICLKDSIPAHDAEQVKKLKTAGAIILGKTNLHEFAFGITTSSSLGGQTLNPYALDHYPGGSSGGTGAAIASNFAAAGLGTDTGGSIRIPSSFNSLVGIRPTIGLSSREGIIPLALTQDVGGPMARTVSDAAIMLDATVGYDKKDVATAYAVGKIPSSYTDFLDVNGLKGARIGIAPELIPSTKAEEKAVADVIHNAVEELKSLGATAVPISIPNWAEINKYPSLSGYEFKFQLNDYLDSLGEDAPYHSLSEIIASGQFDKAQEQSMKARDARETLETTEYKDIVLKRTQVTRESLLKVMADHNLDAIIYPTSTQAAGLIGEGQTSGGNNRLSPFSGFPAITVPAGFTADGLPVGIEFLGRAFDESTLIKLAYSYEQGTHHRQAPKLTP